MTLIRLIEQAAERDPNGPVIKCREGGVQVVLSRTQVCQRARAAAAHIAQHAGTGERAILIYPSDPEYLVAFFAALYAGVTAVPVYPPDPRPQSLPRFLARVVDAKPSLVLTTAAIREQAQSAGLLAHPAFAQVPWLATDIIPAEDATQYRAPALHGRMAAYIQYTSGSTGTPRGVVHLHDNVAANIAMIAQRFEIDHTFSSVVWLPLYHDMGLINSLTSMTYGSYVALMSPTSFLRDPVQWLYTISRERAPVSAAPNFAYDLCLRRVTEQDYAALDLSCWELALNGAEPVRVDTLERFASAFARCGFRKRAFNPSYGLAEATLLVSFGPRHAGPQLLTLDDTALGQGRAQPAKPRERARVLVSAGQVHPEAEVAIVDPETRQRLSHPAVGEIWVRGPGIGQCYWEQPEQSEAVFRAHLAPSGEGPFLRTGDLGFVSDGQLFVTGRIKDLLIIHGKNHYPQDIEAVVAGAHAGVRQGCCVAVSLGTLHGERLAVFFELDERAPDVDPAHVVNAVREAISEQCELAPVVVGVVERRALPKTSSGKLQRAACCAEFLAGKLPLKLLVDEREQEREQEPPAPTPPRLSAAAVFSTLVREISRLLCRPVTPDAIVTRLGMDSVVAVEVMFTLEKEFGIAVAPEHLAEASTLEQLAQRLVSGAQPRAAQPAQLSAVPPVGQSGLRRQRPIELSLMYFSTDTQGTAARYDLLLRSAQFADTHGFCALWLPERHFHQFGGTFPNPASAAAALAMLTQRIRLRAGSVVLPLHHPIRVAEEWGFVDNVSHGRVDLAFATGWNPNDFVLAPETFADRRQVTLERIAQVRQLWQGESRSMLNGRGELVPITVHPRPRQPELTVWLTCTSSADGFVEAGARGYNVLTALLFQRTEQLAEKIQLYRDARARNGHDAEAGVVSLMLHTFLGESTQRVRCTVAEPFKRYLDSSADLWQREWPELGAACGPARERILDLAFERYARGNALFGTPASCAALAQDLHRIGVDEIACLIDFGVETDAVLASLEHLDNLRRMLCGAAVPVEDGSPQLQEGV